MKNLENQTFGENILTNGANGSPQPSNNGSPSDKHQDDGITQLLDPTIELNTFWYAEKKSVTIQGETTTTTIGAKIDHLKFILFLKKCGYYRFDQEHDYTFIYIEHNVIREVAPKDMADFIIDYIERLPDDQFNDGVTRDMVLNAFHRSPQTYFCKQKLALLRTKDGLNINSDIADKGYIYFRNGYLEITAEGISLKDYSTLTSHIWAHQIIDRDFAVGTEESNWLQFTRKVAGVKENDNASAERHKALRSLIGYQIHSYFDCELKATNYTESKVSDHDEGGTGKSLLARSTRYVKSYVEIPGKAFKSDNEKRYQEVTLGTQIVHLNDVKKDFELEGVFNDISDGIRVRKLFREPFTINTKMIISSNRPLVTQGSSAKRRVIEFELADYFNDQRTPETEFNERFFSDLYWDEAKWNAFFNFMANCLKLFLQQGIIPVPELHLSERKLKNESCQEIIDFLDDNIKAETLILNKQENKGDWFQTFVKEYPDYTHLKQKTFTKWLKLYANYKGYKLNESRSGSNLYFIFVKSGQSEMNL